MGRPALRVAMPDDAEALVGIYAHYVKRTASSFEWELSIEALAVAGVGETQMGKGKIFN